MGAKKQRVASRVSACKVLRSDCVESIIFLEIRVASDTRELKAQWFEKSHKSLIFLEIEVAKQPRSTSSYAMDWKLENL